MDFEQNDHLSGPSMPPRQPERPVPGLSAPPPPPPSPPRKTGVWRIFWRIIFVFSILANVVLLFLLFGMAAFFVMGKGGPLIEEVVQKGPAANKIAMITVQGIIDGRMSQDVYQQLEQARQDSRVRGLIVQVNSPGGTISASDQIYKEIRKFRTEKKKPVIAFMQGVAASGGYYTSVACEKIVAEPTAITGSIGVISWYMVVQELLEEKLGILPVTITSGKKKDWPSSFKEPSEEQLQYIREKLIAPAIKRFTDVVAEGRTGSLTPADVNDLAREAEIYVAQEALEEKLIDKVGYLDDAVSLVKSMAGIDKAQVVRYRRPFSFSDILMSRQASLPKLDRTTLYELGTPQVLYLWSAY